MKLSLRNLAYASVFLAALSVIVHEIGGTAGASGFAQAAGNAIAVGDGLVLSPNGRTYYATNGPGSHWVDTQDVSLPLPIPTSQVAFMSDSGTLVIDASGNGWRYTNAQWQSLGPVPGGPAPTVVEPATWSAIKGRFGH